jgi:3',5'-cyclic AMP phosphodiesterase CpdA
MRTLVHLSDLHFGRIDEAILKPLIERTWALSPHAVVISGDLTQRARSAEFKDARAFLDALPAPKIIVPGNHDVPLYNVFDRFFRALDKYKKHITEDLAPFYADGKVALLGVNTARSFTFKGGSVSEEQIAEIKEKMCGLGPELTKIVVTHHPFDLPEASHHEIVGRAKEAMATMVRCGVDVVLSGHLHLIHSARSAERFDVGGHSTLIIQAGTATSTRGRGEPNSFNVIHIDGKKLTVERNLWRAETASFNTSTIEQFEESESGWAAKSGAL